MLKETKRQIINLDHRENVVKHQSSTLFDQSLHAINQHIYASWKEQNRKNMKTICCLTSCSFNLENIYKLDIPSCLKKTIHSTLFNKYNTECWDCEADEFRHQAELKSSEKK
jgi:hypothetical protein